MKEEPILPTFHKSPILSAAKYRKESQKPARKSGKRLTAGCKEDMLPGSADLKSKINREAE